MKKGLLALLVLITAQQAWAQHAQTQQTLFSSKGGKTKVGAYAAPAAKFTSINGNLGVLTGANAGVLLNHKIMLGLGGWSLTNNIATPVVGENGKKQNLNFWYSGFVAEYIHNSDKLIHWSAGALIGGGGVSRREKGFWTDDDDHKKTWNHDATGFFVAEPFVNIEVNIIKNLRFNVGGSYRLVSGSHTEGISDSKLSNPSVHVGLKAGIF